MGQTAAALNTRIRMQISVWRRVKGRQARGVRGEGRREEDTGWVLHIWLLPHEERVGVEELRNQTRDKGRVVATQLLETPVGQEEGEGGGERERERDKQTDRQTDMVCNDCGRLTTTTAGTGQSQSGTSCG